jgi:hypothetical protein
VGVFQAPSGRWVARYKWRGRSYYLGTFDEPDAAANAIAEHRAVHVPEAERLALSKPQHRLTEKDPTTRTGVCAVCGPVELLQHKDDAGRPYWCCAPARRAQRFTPNGSRGRGPHGLERRAAQRRVAGALCEICGDPATANDHCHATKRLRGVLCRGCNIELQTFLDDPEWLEWSAAHLRQRPGTGLSRRRIHDPEWLEAAAAYLRRYSATSLQPEEAPRS